MLVGRLYQLQVMSGDYYMRKSADNFVKELELPATRGQIRDRKGRVLVDNRPAYNVYITPRFFNTDALTKLKKYLALSTTRRPRSRSRSRQATGSIASARFVAFEDITRDSDGAIRDRRRTIYPASPCRRWRIATIRTARSPRTCSAT